LLYTSPTLLELIAPVQKNYLAIFCGDIQLINVKLLSRYDLNYVRDLDTASFILKNSNLARGFRGSADYYDLIKDRKIGHLYFYYNLLTSKDKAMFTTNFINDFIRSSETKPIHVELVELFVKLFDYDINYPKEPHSHSLLYQAIIRDNVLLMKYLLECSTFVINIETIGQAAYSVTSKFQAIKLLLADRRFIEIFKGWRGTNISALNHMLVRCEAHELIYQVYGEKTNDETKYRDLKLLIEFSSAEGLERYCDRYYGDTTGIEMHPSVTNIETAKYLLDHFTVNNKEELFIEALKNYSGPFLNFLLEKYSYDWLINHSNFPDLFVSALLDKPEMIEILLKHKVPIPDKLFIKAYRALTNSSKQSTILGKYIDTVEWEEGTV
jgi:hypothetical protein